MNDRPAFKVCTSSQEKISSGAEPQTEILLAEDNPADVYLIREALREHAVAEKLRVAADGKEVLRIFSLLRDEPGASRIGLVILDLNLPRHDGIEILQYLHDSPHLSHIPVVVLTSSDSPRDRDIATRLGAARYLRKPSSLDQFLGLGAVFKNLLEQAPERLDA